MNHSIFIRYHIFFETFDPPDELTEYDIKEYLYDNYKIITGYNKDYGVFQLKFSNDKDLYTLFLLEYSDIKHINGASLNWLQYEEYSF